MPVASEDLRRTAPGVTLQHKRKPVWGKAKSRVSSKGRAGAGAVNAKALKVSMNLQKVRMARVSKGPR